VRHERKYDTNEPLYIETGKRGRMGLAEKEKEEEKEKGRGGLDHHTYQFVRQCVCTLGVACRIKLVTPISDRLGDLANWSSLF
jgi:hypothetical protein